MRFQKPPAAPGEKKQRDETFANVSEDHLNVIRSLLRKDNKTPYMGVLGRLWALAKTDMIKFIQSKAQALVGLSIL